MKTWLSRDMAAFIVPLAICGLCILGYNYARFGNPLEFGLNYLMAEPSYQNVRPALVNIWPSLYYFLFCAPMLEPVFPFLRLAFKIPFESLGYHLPTRYFNEGTGGVLVLCPVVLLAGALLLFRSKMNRHAGLVVAWAATAYSVLCVFSIASLGLVSQRYEIDFEPYLLLAACIGMSFALKLFRGRKRVWAKAGFVSMMLWSILANMALAVQGPYDQFVQAHPTSYLKLAQWFSPVERFRPLLNPSVHIYGYFNFPYPCFGVQPLFSIGEFGSGYMVYAECKEDSQISILSSWGDPRFAPTRSADIPMERAGFERVDADFSPQDRNVTLRWNGRVILTHPLPFLLTARSQVRLGWNPNLGRKIEFTGRVILPLAPEP